MKIVLAGTSTTSIIIWKSILKQKDKKITGEMTVALSFLTAVLEAKHWADILNFGRKGALYNTTFPFPH